VKEREIVAKKKKDSNFWRNYAWATLGVCGFFVRVWYKEGSSRQGILQGLGEGLAALYFLCCCCFAFGAIVLEHSKFSDNPKLRDKSLFHKVFVVFTGLQWPMLLLFLFNVLTDGFGTIRRYF
jgi:hypothetical protein